MTTNQGFKDVSMMKGLNITNLVYIVAINKILGKGF